VYLVLTSHSWESWQQPPAQLQQQVGVGAGMLLDPAAVVPLTMRTIRDTDGTPRESFNDNM
jgi:hypothetical protein